MNIDFSLIELKEEIQRLNLLLVKRTVAAQTGEVSIYQITIYFGNTDINLPCDNYSQ